MSDLTLEAGVVDPPQLITDDLTAFGRLTVTRCLRAQPAERAAARFYGEA